MPRRNIGYLNRPSLTREKRYAQINHLPRFNSDNLNYAGELPVNRENRTDNNWQETPLGQLIMKILYASMVIRGKLPAPKQTKDKGRR